MNRWDWRLANRDECPASRVGLSCARPTVLQYRYLIEDLLF